MTEMSLRQGWINRQFARVERDAKNWPDWMRRETEIRASEQKMKSDSETEAVTEPHVPPVTKVGTL